MSMPIIDLTLHGDSAWPDLTSGTYIDVGTRIRVIRLRGGMASGKDSLAIRLDPSDGAPVVAQTSVAAWLAVARALEGAEQGERERGERP